MAGLGRERSSCCVVPHSIFRSRKPVAFGLAGHFQNWILASIVFDFAGLRQPAGHNLPIVLAAGQSTSDLSFLAKFVQNQLSTAVSLTLKRFVSRLFGLLSFMCFQFQSYDVTIIQFMTESERRTCLNSVNANVTSQATGVCHSAFQKQ